MDPLSIVFAAYLEFIAGDIREEAEAADSAPHALIVEYLGMEIPFQYQSAAVVNDSVCDLYKTQTADYAACTVNAKLLFNDLCGELSALDEKHSKFVRTKNMYCAAASEYQPISAQITRPSAATPLETARQQCNLVVAQTMGATDWESVTARKKACKRYESLK